jgi:hypothetical protein
MIYLELNKKILEVNEMENQIQIVPVHAEDFINEMLQKKQQAGLELLDIVPLFEYPSKFGECKETQAMYLFVPSNECHQYRYKFFSGLNPNPHEQHKNMNQYVNDQNNEGYELYKVVVYERFSGKPEEGIGSKIPSFGVVVKKK